MQSDGEGYIHNTHKNMVHNREKQACKHPTTVLWKNIKPSLIHHRLYIRLRMKCLIDVAFSVFSCLACELSSLSLAVYGTQL
jgi:hypothetical protein